MVSDFTSSGQFSHLFKGRDAHKNLLGVLQGVMYAEKKKPNTLKTDLALVPKLVLGVPIDGKAGKHSGRHSGLTGLD